VGVVQQDQHPPPGQHAAVEPGPRGHAVGDLVGRHLERVEKLDDCRLRSHGNSCRVVSAQVDVQLAVREAPGDPVRPVHGESCLPDAGRAGDHRDRWRPVRRREQRVQRRQLGLSSGESRHRCG
jgi:hypothetical protein